MAYQNTEATWNLFPKATAELERMGFTRQPYSPTESYYIRHPDRLSDRMMAFFADGDFRIEHSMDDPNRGEIAGLTDGMNPTWHSSDEADILAAIARWDVRIAAESA